MKKKINLGDSPYEQAIRESSIYLKQELDSTGFGYLIPKIAVMCGTSGPFTEEGLQNSKGIRVLSVTSYKEAGFPVPKVSGHEGKIYSVLIGKIPVLICCGRIHYFEGHSMDTIVHSIRALALFGVEKFILTNASGSLDPDKYTTGDIVAITDHVNYLGDSPLRGEANAFKEFVDMSEPYSKSILQKYQRLTKLEFSKHTHVGKEGIYTATPGREFETPAEVKNKFAPVADLVGMSTIPEVIAGRQMGCEMCALSLVTNIAAGLSSEEITHDENLNVVASSSKLFSDVIIKLILKCGND